MKYQYTGYEYIKLLRLRNSFEIYNNRKAKKNKHRCLTNKVLQGVRVLVFYATFNNI